MPSSEQLLRQAIATYDRAVALAPKNLAIRLHLANAYAALEEYDTALRQYEEIVALWPRSFEARYRYAATLTFDPGDSAADAEAKKARLDEAAQQWKEAKRLVSWWSAVHRLFHPRPFLRAGAAIRPSDAVPWNLARARLRNAVIVAMICTEIQADGGGRDAEARVASRLRRYRAVDWQVRYNAACCLSRLYERSEDTSLPDKAVKQLDLAYRDPAGQLSLSWVQVDPDVAPIGRTPEYQAWCDRVTPDREPEPEHVPDALWEGVAALAGVRLKSWQYAVKRPGTLAHSARAVRELEAWMAVHSAAANPDEKTLGVLYALGKSVLPTERGAVEPNPRLRMLAANAEKAWLARGGRGTPMKEADAWAALAAWRALALWAQAPDDPAARAHAEEVVRVPAPA